MKLENKELVNLLQLAYSAEKAAAFAYQGHAGSLKNISEKKDINKIENDEWIHREDVLLLMKKYNVPISKYYEIKFFIIGKIISFSCYFIGWFMPFYFAGRLESGNVCEYFKMKELFNNIGINEHDSILYQMGITEKEHEVYFLEKIKNNKLLPVFEKIFSWGKHNSFNDIELDKKPKVNDKNIFCNTNKH
ncbi:MAG: hypothetical protein U0457_14950 [Candidatus Sericytochromatia bacterium]